MPRPVGAARPPRPAPVPPRGTGGTRGGVGSGVSGSGVGRGVGVAGRRRRLGAGAGHAGDGRGVRHGLDDQLAVGLASHEQRRHAAVGQRHRLGGRGPQAGPDVDLPRPRGHRGVRGGRAVEEVAPERRAAGEVDVQRADAVRALHDADLRRSRRGRGGLVVEHLQLRAARRRRVDERRGLRGAGGHVDGHPHRRRARGARAGRAGRERVGAGGLGEVRRGAPVGHARGDERLGQVGAGDVHVDRGRHGRQVRDAQHAGRAVGRGGRDAEGHGRGHHGDEHRGERDPHQGPAPGRAPRGGRGGVGRWGVGLVLRSGHGGAPRRRGDGGGTNGERDDQGAGRRQRRVRSVSDHSPHGTRSP